MGMKRFQRIALVFLFRQKKSSSGVHPYLKSLNLKVYLNPEFIIGNLSNWQFSVMQILQVRLDVMNIIGYASKRSVENKDH